METVVQLSNGEIDHINVNIEFSLNVQMYHNSEKRGLDVGKKYKQTKTDYAKTFTLTIEKGTYDMR